MHVLSFVIVLLIAISITCFRSWSIESMIIGANNLDPCNADGTRRHYCKAVSGLESLCLHKVSTAYTPASAVKTKLIEDGKGEDACNVPVDNQDYFACEQAKDALVSTLACQPTPNNPVN